MIFGFMAQRRGKKTSHHPASDRILPRMLADSVDGYDMPKIRWSKAHHRLCADNQGCTKGCGAGVLQFLADIYQVGGMQRHGES